MIALSTQTTQCSLLTTFNLKTMLDAKKKKAIMIAVSCFLEEEREQQQKKQPKVTWSKNGRNIMMSNRQRLQVRGKLI